jgi:hypothetical protein
MPDEEGPELRAARDPGDAVPPGVAPTQPAPLAAEDRKAKRKLDQMGAKATAEPEAPQGPAATRGPERSGP